MWIPGTRSITLIPHALKKEGADRGELAHFYFGPEVDACAGVAFVQTLIRHIGGEQAGSMLSKGQDGEQNYARIQLILEERVVKVHHRYWSTAQIEGFFAVVRTVAEIHQITITRF